MTTALDITGLRFAYDAAGGAPPLLDVARLTLDRTDQMLVTGTSGTGKSTLLHLIAGLIDPQAGSILVGEQDIVSMSPAARDRWRGRHIGMIFQTFNLVHGFSAIENVMLAMVVSDIPTRDHRSRARSLLDELKIDRPDANPDRMSVGQRQRVAVARALASDPVLMLADEPTASLDPDTAQTSLDLIQGMCADREIALLCTSHDPAMQARFQHRTALSELSNVSSDDAAPAEASP